ncbi:hypothetical protein ABZ471_14310 [Streptomyces sp. NPDC005728]|uniref:hypothetical protein n=1 Tax=Streptomyces sp. NPDC005728 TaxID=3157054 RepID=UPI0033D32F6F
MVRSSRKARRLVVVDETFLWSLRHEHRVDQGRYEDCRELLTPRRWGAQGRLLIVFQRCDGRLVPDGYLPSGAVGTTDDVWLNLHEPGTVRALLDEAIGRGWNIDDPATAEFDGWDLFDLVAMSRAEIPHE